MKLKKKSMLLVLALALCLGLCACGGSADGDASSAPSVSSGAGPVGGAPEADKEPAGNNSFNPDYMEVTATKDFSEGMALIQFEDKTTQLTYMGFIDKTGALQAYSAAVKDVGYMDGYVYMTDGDTVHVLDQELKLLSSYPKNTVKGYGGGYTVTVEQNTGFDASGYTARILTAAGQEVTSKVFSSQIVVRYDGQGVCTFLDQQKRNAAGVYCAASDTWLDELRTGVGIRGNWFTCHFNTDEPGAPFDYFDASGVLKSAVFPEGYLPYEGGYLIAAVFGVGGINDTMAFCLIDGPRYVIEYMAFNAKSGTFSRYQGAYGDRFSYVEQLVSGSGRFAAPMEGSDGQLYTLLLSETMEDASGPILGEPKAIGDGYLYTKSGSECIVYDLEGNEVSRPENIPDSSDKVRDGVYLSRDSYYNADGTPLFESVDYSTGRLVDLP